MKQEVAMYWQADEGIWIINVPFCVEQRMIQPAINFMLKVQRQRYLSLKPGPVRDDLSISMQTVCQHTRDWQPYYFTRREPWVRKFRS
jgi:hypothetical protein